MAGCGVGMDRRGIFRPRGKKDGSAAFAPFKKGREGELSDARVPKVYVLIIRYC